MTSSRASLGGFAAEREFCAICWARQDLHIHHMVGGAARKHERCNLLRLCASCHASLHDSGRDDAVSKGHCLLAKREQDTDNYSPSDLAALRHRVGLAYEPERLPPWVLDRRRKAGLPREYVEMAINSRTKGKRGELEAAAAINSVVPKAAARRGVQYKGTESSSDVVAPGLPNLWIEVKRVQRLSIHETVKTAAAQCGSMTPVVVHRKNDEGWLLTIRLEDLPSFVREVFGGLV